MTEFIVREVHFKISDLADMTENWIVGELIRCKDCRFYQDNNDGYPHPDCKWNENETPDEEDFCSGAERRRP